MTPVEKFREVVAATRASGGKFVVRTLDEAQALLDEIDPPSVTLEFTGEQVAEFLRIANNRPPGRLVLIDPPGDDEVV